MQKGQPEKMLNHSVSAIESVYITSLRYVCSVCISAVTKTFFFFDGSINKMEIVPSNCGVASSGYIRPQSQEAIGDLSFFFSF